jgi:cyclin-dependent kinase
VVRQATWPGLTALQDWHVYPDFRAVPLVERCPHLGADGLDLLEGLLQLNPAKRMDARAALNHPYFDEMRSSASTSYKL